MGYVVKGQEDKVLKLKKALYSLKQAPRVWNNRIDNYFHKHDFTRCMNKYALYVKKWGNDFLFIYIYIDDLIYTGNNRSMFEEFKKAIIQEFEMTYINLISYYLGIKAHQLEDDIFIFQKCYTKEVLKRFNMFICKPSSTPWKVV